MLMLSFLSLYLLKGVEYATQTPYGTTCSTDYVHLVSNKPHKKLPYNIHESSLEK